MSQVLRKKCVTHFPPLNPMHFPGSPPSVRIDLYQNSALHVKDFAIPSRPGKPFEKSITHDTLVIEWTAPVRGTENLLEYEVSSFKKKNEEIFTFTQSLSEADGGLDPRPCNCRHFI